jgi:DEAD/DEAH box helicase
MVRKGTKRQRNDSTVTSRRDIQQGIGWTKVDVGLEKDDLGDGGQENRNHYDDAKLASRAGYDLEADTSENPGVFLGLEVLDGNQYKIINDEKTGTKQFFVIPRGSATDDNLAKQVHADESEADPPAKNSKLKEKKKKKKKPKKKPDPNEESLGDVSKIGTELVQAENGDQDQLAKKQEQLALIQSQWMSAAGGASLHPKLYDALLQNKWLNPTPIQAAVLPAAILGRRNIVGAAPTGSGKTLAFLLPIYQYLLDQHDEQLHLDMPSTRTLQALILTPTRELALQIHTEAEKLWKGHIGTLVGGLALPKQHRVLDKNRPAVITATPGRLWELVCKVYA